MGSDPPSNWTNPPGLHPRSVSSLHSLIKFGLQYWQYFNRHALHLWTKAALLMSPALWPIDYTSDTLVILTVDTSQITIGFLLCQCDAENLCIHHFACFGSITLNDHKYCFLPAQAWTVWPVPSLVLSKAYLIRVRNLVVEVVVRYIKGMLVNRNIAPSASINCWIVSILLFHSTLVHVLGTRHSHDGLSQWPKQPADEDGEPTEDLDFDDWVDQVYGFMHFSTHWSQQFHVQNHPQHMFPAPLTTTVSPKSLPTNPHSDTTYSHDLIDPAQPTTICATFGTMECPPGLTNTTYAAFLHYTNYFFQKDGHLWRRDPQGHHKVVIDCDKWPAILTARHHGDFTTHTHITNHFWWPHLSANIAWFIRTCHIWQLRQTCNVLIPPVVATPLPLFAKMYMDTMHLPKSGSFKYFVQGHCSLAHFPKYHWYAKDATKIYGARDLSINPMWLWGCDLGIWDHLQVW